MNTLIFDLSYPIFFKHFIIGLIFETYNKSDIFQNLVWMRKDDHLVAQDVQMAPFVASPAVRVIQPVQMIDVRMRKDDHQWDEKHVQMGKFIAPIQAHAPYLKNVELAKPSD